MSILTCSLLNYFSITVFLIFNKFNEKIFPKINFILGNNAVEQRGAKSNYFGEDLIELNQI